MIDLSLRLNSITDATETARDKVAVCGSHGGMLAAQLASQAGLRAVIFHDAGIGFEDAGVAGVLALGRIGMAAATVSANDCAIGSADDMYDNGNISTINSEAKKLGIKLNMNVAEALTLLQNAPSPHGQLPVDEEVRSEVTLQGGTLKIILADSASLVKPDDIDRIIITGSHGGLIGGNPERALKAKARIAVFNDAGFTASDIKTSRLPALDERGVAAVLISCHTARIGEATSALETGTISFANNLATKLGASKGRQLKEWLETLPAP